MKEFSQIKFEEELVKKLKKSLTKRSSSQTMLFNHARNTLYKYNYDFRTIVSIFQNCKDMAILEAQYGNNY